MMNTYNEKRRKRQGGFSLIELLVVIAIIAILGAAVAPKLLQNPEKARRAAAMSDVKSLQLQADIYQLDNAKPISSISDLVPKYIDEVPQDPWGGEYVVTVQGDGTVKISCSKLDSEGKGVSSGDATFGAD
jgi:general secretion pathway protein G